MDLCLLQALLLRYRAVDIKRWDYRFPSIKFQKKEVTEKRTWIGYEPNLCERSGSYIRRVQRRIFPPEFARMSETTKAHIYVSPSSFCEESIKNVGLENLYPRLRCPLLFKIHNFSFLTI